MNYPFTNCYNPRTVVNPYTKDLLRVGCGVCKACLTSRTQKMSMLCSLEEQDNVYCAFVTLTYSNRFIPVCKPIFNPSDNCYDIVDFDERVGAVGTVFGRDYVDAHKSPFYMDKLLKKINLKGFIGYASRRDLQLFLKRVRDRIFRKTNEKIRFYAVSEYGPVHFRPHFHLLLYFNSASTLKVMSSVVRKSWTLGRVDYSLSRGKCSSYVSSYVNSSVSLPRLFAFDALKPFSSHSNFFAQEFYRRKKEEIYENAPSSFAVLCRVLNAKNVEVRPWRSLTALFFPRCRDFSNKSYRELYESYTVLRECEQEFKFTSVSHLTGILLSMVQDFINEDYVVPSDHYSPRIQKIFRILGIDFGLYRFHQTKTGNFLDYYRNRIYSDLSISQRFLYFCCKDCSDYGDRCRTLDMICNYYSYRDMSNLRDMYSAQLDYLSEYPSESPLSLLLFYDNSFPPYGFSHDYKAFHAFLDSCDVSSYDKTECLFKRITFVDMLKSNPMFKNYRCTIEERFERGIKHKKLNDLNNIFIND